MVFKLDWEWVKRINYPVIYNKIWQDIRKNLKEIINDYKVFSDMELASKVYYLYKKYKISIPALQRYVENFLFIKNIDYSSNYSSEVIWIISSFLDSMGYLLEVFPLNYIIENIEWDDIFKIFKLKNVLGTENLKKFIFAIVESDLLIEDILEKLKKQSISLVVSHLSKENLKAIFKYDLNLIGDIFSKIFKILYRNPRLDFSKIQFIFYTGKLVDYLNFILDYLEKNKDKHNIELYRLLFKKFKEDRWDMSDFYSSDVDLYFSVSAEEISYFEISWKNRKEKIKKIKDTIKKQALIISKIARKFDKEFDWNKSLEENIKNAFEDMSYTQLTVNQKIQIIDRMKNYYDRARLIKHILHVNDNDGKKVLKDLLGVEAKWSVEIKQLKSSIVFFVESEDFESLYYNKEKVSMVGGFLTYRSNNPKLSWSIIVVRKNKNKKELLQIITHEYRHCLNHIVTFDRKEKFYDIKDEMVAFMSENYINDLDILLFVLSDPNWIYAYDYITVRNFLKKAKKVKEKYPDIYLDILTIVDSKYWDLFI